MREAQVIEYLQQRITATCGACGLALEELQQSYLAHLIYRFSDIQSLSQGALDPIDRLIDLQTDQLHNLADECLLRCGLQNQPDLDNWTFDRSLVHTGQNSYQMLATRVHGREGQLFSELGLSFVELAIVLQAMAQACDATTDILNALEIWRDSVDPGDHNSIQYTVGPSRIVAFDRRGWSSRH